MALWAAFKKVSVMLGEEFPLLTVILKFIRATPTESGRDTGRELSYFKHGGIIYTLLNSLKSKIGVTGLHNYHTCL